MALTAGLSSIRSAGGIADIGLLSPNNPVHVRATRLKVFRLTVDGPSRATPGSALFSLDYISFTHDANSSCIVISSSTLTSLHCPPVRRRSSGGGGAGRWAGSGLQGAGSPLLPDTR